MAVKEKVYNSVRERHRVKPPKRWGVKFYNDDVTSFDAVILILMQVFEQDIMQAFAFAQAVDKEGSGIIGNYSKEIAEEKKQEALSLTKELKVPLRIEAIELEDE